ncbi:hypothetical protein Mapa_014830 [Marchantia paleacea]|nr:hypothetical protein Mapa_014830 [Marchantia paleacea]
MRTKVCPTTSQWPMTTNKPTDTHAHLINSCATSPTMSSALPLVNKPTQEVTRAGAPVEGSSAGHITGDSREISA